MNNEKTMSKSAFDFGKKNELIQTILMMIIALAAPAFLQQLLKASPLANYAQYIVGSIVNTALIIAAINLKGLKRIMNAALED